MTDKPGRAQRIALGVSGGIACYKSAEILRRLQDRGFDVVVLMTAGARRFVTPLTFEALSGYPVYTDIFHDGPRSGADDPFDHIFLAQSVRLLLVAPATADCIARFTAGIADDFLTTFHLAFRGPVVLAPSMNTRMWEHPSVQENLAILRRRGARVIDPESGRMACRTEGPGRLPEVTAIVQAVDAILGGGDLEGRTILVTAGPTQADIDPVRFISNRSSGRMGFAIGQAVMERGGEVIMIAGPTTIDFPGAIRVRTVAEMKRAVLEHLPRADAVIKAAAPLDFAPAEMAPQKIKKGGGLDLRLEPAPDILGELGAARHSQVLVGFAAETENHAEGGRAKLRAKNLDLVVVNPVSGPDSAFDSDMNQAIIIDASGREEALPRMPKIELAHRILDRLAPLMAARPREKGAPGTSIDHGS